MQDDPVRHLTLQFLSWIAEKPRSYEDVMDAWRTSCPRLPVWEDAISQGLVKRKSGPSLQQSMVCITTKGRSVLSAHSRVSGNPVIAEIAAFRSPLSRG